MEENYDLKKFDLLVELLVELFNIEEEVLNRKISRENVKLSVNVDDIAIKLSTRWNYLFENAQSFDDIQTFFMDDYLPWKEKIESFKAAKKEENLSEFLESHFSTWQKLSFEYKNLKVKEIEGILYKDRPFISQYYEKFDGEFVNLLIYDNNFLHVILHLNLVKNDFGTFTLLITFSFWLDFHSFNQSPNLHSINEKFRFEILAHNIFNRLKALGYIQIPTVVQNENDQKYGYYPKDFTVRISIIQPSYCCILKTLSDNPIELFNEIKLHLIQIEKLKLEILDKKELSPTNWYRNLPIKLKNFLIKGRELLYQVEDFLKLQEEKAKPTEKISIKKNQEDFSQIIIGIFKDAYEKDKRDNSIKEEDRGFRTINEIYDNYEDFIDISRPTFYKHFKNLNVTMFLERRKKLGLGGGFQYRYKALEIRSLARIKEKKVNKQKKIDDQDFRIDKVRIQEALINFKEKKYQNVIDIIENILKSPSDRLIQEKSLYATCFFYIGLSYYKLKQYEKSFQYFEKTNLIDNTLIDVRYCMILCKFNGGDYKYSLNNCIKLITNIEKIIYQSEINLDYQRVRSDSFHYHDLEEMNLKKIKENNLSDYFIPFKTEVNPIHLDLTYNHEEIKNPAKFIEKFKKTILSLRNLYKILIKLCYLRFELTRRIIFKQIIKKNDLEIIKNLEDLIEFHKKVEEEYHFINNQYLTFRPYLAYFRNLFELFNLEELAGKIKLEYPALKELEFFLPHWLFKSIQRHAHFVNHINSYFRSAFQDRSLYIYTRRKFKEASLEIEIYNDNLIIESEEKDLIAEDFVVQVKIIEKYSLEKFIDDFNEYNKIKIDNLDNFDKLISKIERIYAPSYSDDKPVVYLNLVRKAIDYCKSLRFNKYTKYLQDLNNIIEIRYKRFKELEGEFKNKIYIKMCEYWANNFNRNQDIINLELEYNPKKSQLKWMVTDSVLREIGDIIKDNPKNYIINIKLFNNEIVDEVIEIIKEFSLYFKYYKLYHFRIDQNLTFKKEVDQGIIKIKTNMFLDISKLKGSFEEKLDYIYYTILGVLKYGITKLKIYVSKKNMKKFKDYFSNQFSFDFKNDKLIIEVDENSEDNCFKLTIIKF